MKTIHTFFGDIVGFDLIDERKLLSLWTNHWSECGFKTVILNENHARRHPKFEAFDAKISTMPTVNNRAYERFCFIRWLAIAMEGGGIMCDFDCFQVAPWAPVAFSPVTVYQGEIPESACPSLVAGIKEGYNAFIDFVIGLPDGFCSLMDSPKTVDAGTRACVAENKQTQHTSDMTIWRDFIIAGGAIIDRKVWNWNETGFENAAILHMNRGSLHPIGLRPRWKHIPKLLDEIKAKRKL